MSHDLTECLTGACLRDYSYCMKRILAIARIRLTNVVLEMQAATTEECI